MLANAFRQCTTFLPKSLEIQVIKSPLRSISTFKSSCAKSNLKQDEVQQNQGTSNPENDTVDFGFETVTPQEKAQKVHHVFENVAKKYDLMNDAMSAGVHRLWKDYFVRKMTPFSPGTKVIDVAGGTGDIAFRMARYIQQSNYKINAGLENAPQDPSTILVSDINQAMLDVGKERAKNLEDLDPNVLSWLCADAQNLPLEDESFDLFTIAFGIRNVVDISKVLDEAYRVLRPGGRFMCLEFSQVKNPLVNWVYDTYSFQVIPPMGEVLAGDWKSYQYLVESIRKFPNQERFKEMIEEAGFRCVTFENLTFGVVAIHSGFKI